MAHLDQQVVGGDAERSSEPEDGRGTRVFGTAALLDLAEVGAVEADAQRQVDLTELLLLPQANDSATELHRCQRLRQLTHISWAMAHVGVCTSFICWRQLQRVRQP